MRAVLTVLAVLLVVLAGCTAPQGGDSGTTDADSPTAPSPNTTSPTETTTEETQTQPDETTTQEETPPEDNESQSEMVAHRPDPATDTIGWEAGIWHNETINVTNSDGMNATERELAVARAMARVEYVRQLEYPGNETIPVDVISRAEYKNRTSNRTDHSEAYRIFDNVKFEALLFVGENTDSIDVQNRNRGSSVGGYYSPSNNSIVLISSDETPSFNGEETLAQEVAHGLQDVTYNLTAIRDQVDTRDSYNGQNGLLEGDGNLIDELYTDRCGVEWTCIDAPESNETNGGGDDLHFGIYLMEFFPYSDGPVFIRTYHNQGGWNRIDEMYDDPPASAEQVIYPEKYPDDKPANVSLTDRHSGDWERVRPSDEDQIAYDTLGQSALSAMFMYTVYADYGGDPVVNPLTFLNLENGEVNSSDPLNYDLEPTSGWEGDRLHVYSENSTNETGYVWRITWESSTDASQFAQTYRELLAYWGGSQTDGVWTIEEESPFTDAFSVTVEDETVTIVNAPTVEDLGDVYEPAGN